MIISNQIQEIDEEREMNRKKRRSEEREREGKREKELHSTRDEVVAGGDPKKRKKKCGTQHQADLLIHQINPSYMTTKYVLLLLYTRTRYLHMHRTRQSCARFLQDRPRKHKKSLVSPFLDSGFGIAPQ